MRKSSALFAGMVVLLVNVAYGDCGQTVAPSQPSTKPAAVCFYTLSDHDRVAITESAHPEPIALGDTIYGRGGSRFDFVLTQRDRSCKLGFRLVPSGGMGPVPSSTPYMVRNAGCKILHVFKDKDVLRIVLDEYDTLKCLTIKTAENADKPVQIISDCVLAYEAYKGREFVSATLEQGALTIRLRDTSEPKKQRGFVWQLPQKPGDYRLDPVTQFQIADDKR